MKPATDPAGFLPLSCAELHILLALRGEQKHGYAMMQQVAQETQGQVRLGPATLYGTIKRLIAKDLIAECAGRRDPDRDDVRRRHYRLVPLGRRVLEAELRRLSGIIEIAVAAGLMKPQPR